MLQISNAQLFVPRVRNESTGCLYFFHKFCVICRYSKNYLNPNKVEKKLLRSKSVHGTKRQKKYEIED